MLSRSNGGKGGKLLRGMVMMAVAPSPALDCGAVAYDGCV